MTEFEKGRAAGLAEAVKVVQGYGDMVKAHGHMPVDPYKAVCEAVSEIASALQALAASSADHVLVPRHLLIEALVIGEAAVNDDYRRPCGQVPFETAHKFKMAAFRKIRAMIAQGEK